MSSFSSFYKKWKMKELKVEVPSPASLNKKFSTVQQVPVSLNFPKSAFSADGRKKTVTKKADSNSFREPKSKTPRYKDLPGLPPIKKTDQKWP